MTELKINSYNTVWHMANKVKAVANHSPKDKCIFRELENIFRRHRFISVSYTHLTLPTIRLV